VTYVLSFRDESRNRGGPVLGGRLRRLDPARVSEGLPARVTEGPLARDALAVEERVIFLVHGFNVSLRDGEQTLREFAALLPSHRDVGLVVTLWPGDHWVGAASYPFEGRDADDTAFELARFIEDTLAPRTPISFVSHSLGGRVVLGAMSRLSAEYPVEQVCVMAAAVDDFSLSEADDYRAAVERSERVGVLSSKKDKVLRFAYPAGDLLQSFLFFWREQSGLALGYHGPRSARDAPVPGNVLHEGIPESREVDHGDYLPADPPSDQEQLAKWRSAAIFADQVLAGREEPDYP
jgi:hypothetical protein